LTSGASLSAESASLNTGQDSELIEHEDALYDTAFQVMSLMRPGPNPILAVRLGIGESSRGRQTFVISKWNELQHL